MFLTATIIKKCNNAVDNYPHALEFVPECYKTPKMCDTYTVNTYPYNKICLQEMWCIVFDSIPNQYITQEICGGVISEDYFNSILSW